jgi:O-acetyl-ADP-ribose deacetylase (regulator of RNase III)
MITYRKGNLPEDGAETLVNTVNTVGVMGKGIALAFKQAFPYNFMVYKDACKNGRLKIGQVLAVRDRNLLLGEKLIVNFPTKTHWRFPSEYSYIISGLKALSAFLIENPVNSLAIPALGCGNGGLDWAIVKPMMEGYLSGLDIEITVYEPA